MLAVWKWGEVGDAAQVVGKNKLAASAAVGIANPVQSSS
jgi:hypothetical protein